MYPCTAVMAGGYVSHKSEHHSSLGAWPNANDYNVFVRVHGVRISWVANLGNGS
jgi:hypothetical protein